MLVSRMQGPPCFNNRGFQIADARGTSSQALLLVSNEVWHDICSEFENGVSGCNSCVWFGGIEVDGIVC